MSRFSEHFLGELKDRVRVSDVVGKRVTLRRQGRELVGLSPFAKEKTPSFCVNDDKGFYHCFASGEHGDVIEWLTKGERMTFVEAVEHLAGLAGLEVPKADPRAAAQAQARKGLGDWLELAAEWFAVRLHAGNEATAARAYLEQRGVPKEVWSRFRLGYAPDDRSGLKSALIARGATPGDLIAAGLLVSPEDGGSPFDRFRDRIMFPICDARGRVVSFGGRALNPARKAKYLNGPETAVFHKSRVLYGLHGARQLLADGGALVVVEGYLDVIACQRAGVAAVASMGTALTPDQIGLLWRLHGEPTLCFDGDRAGRAAAGRAMETALPLVEPGKSLRFSIVKGGKDPDDVYRDLGAEALRASLAVTTPFSRALFERERDAAPLDTPEAMALLMARLLKHVAAMGHKDLARLYRDTFYGWRRDLFAGRDRSARRGGATAEALAAAEALRTSADDVVSRLMALPPEDIDGHAARLFDLHDRIGQVQARMDELREQLSTSAQMAEFAALKGERDGLQRQIREEPMAGGVA